jgi:hypothetical protein
MKSILALALVPLLCPALASADPAPKSDFALGHALYSARVNRLVGLWDARVDVGPCAGGPRRQFRAMNVFHAGGTLSDFNTLPGSARGPGFGVWQFQPSVERYESRFQFYRYLADGSFDGVQDVHQETTLSDDGNGLTSTVVARVLNPDDSLRVELCGTATATRVGILP